MLNTKLTISQKLKIKKKNSKIFFRTLRIFLERFFLWCIKIVWAIVFQKLKIGKLTFHSSQNIITCYFRPKKENGSFWGGEGRGGLHVINWGKAHDVTFLYLWSSYIHTYMFYISKFTKYLLIKLLLFLNVWIRILRMITACMFERFPASGQWEQRNQLYQLFHYMNHWNHFGRGYASSSLRIVKTLLETLWSRQNSNITTFFLSKKIIFNSGFIEYSCVTTTQRI